MKDALTLPAAASREALAKVSRTQLWNEILTTLGKRGLTAREIGIRLGYGENARQAVAPRLTELVKRDRVEVIGRKLDHMTGTHVSIYRRTDYDSL